MTRLIPFLDDAASADGVIGKDTGWNGPEALIDWHLGFRSAIDGFCARRSFFVRTVTEVELPPTRDVVGAAAPSEPAAPAALG